MKDRKRAQIDVIEAMLDSVLRATAQVRGRERPKASLRHHLEDLDEAIEFARKRVVVTELYTKLIERDVHRALKAAAQDGAVDSVRDAIATMVVEEVAPYVDGDEELAKVAGRLLARILDDEKHEKRWIAQFRADDR